MRWRSRTTLAFFVDLRLVDPLTAPRFTQVAFRSERTMRGVPSRRAYLVNEGVQFGVARMIQSMAPEDVQLEVFTDEGAAVEWLTTHGPDPASSSALRPFE